MQGHYWDLAAKHLAGKATLAEQAELNQWLAENPEHEAQYQAQQRLWQTTAPAIAPEVDTDAAWLKVSARLAPHAPAAPETRVISLYPQLLRVAAAVALLMGFVWLAQYLFFPHMGMQVVSSGDQRVSVMLPDSSQVWLNRYSKLIYDPDFDGETRTVTLEGEAFFEVKHNPDRPFIIQTERTQTRVLGTSFNLRDKTSEATAELAVATGKVAFSSKKGETSKMVTAGHTALLDAQGQVLTEKTQVNPNKWAWRTGRLVFNGQSLAEVLRDLERYYDVKLQVQDAALARCRFTGTFEHDELESVLQVLATSLQLNYKQQNNTTYTLSGQGCR